MSADNILVILHNRGKIRVYDVNFSWVSCLNGWSFPMTREGSQAVTKAIVNSPYEREVHACDTEDQAIRFCTRYQRVHVVEYDHSSIIPKPTAEEIQKAVKKKRKAKLK